VDFNNLLTGALAVLALATAGGYGLLRGRVSALRDELKDEREGRTSDRETIRQLRESLAAALADVAALRADVEAIGRVARGEAHWVAVGEQLDIHHTAASAHWAKDEELTAAMLAALEALKEVLDRE
jgi:hypothetical protein